MVTDSGWVLWERIVDMELDLDLLLSPPFVRVLEQDGEHAGVQCMTELAEPAREAALLGLGSSG